MGRREKLNELCSELDAGTKTATVQLIDEIVFLESQLTVLKEYPFIKVNPKDPTQQKATYAAKQYKELLQQYNNCLKIFLGVLGKIENAETSPLRQYLDALKQKSGV